MEDKKIVELYWRRSEQAISETSAKYAKYCYSIARNILGNNEDTEESVNDTYQEAWSCIPPHRPAVLSVFLGKITRRISIDRLRQRNARKRGGGEAALVLDELLECVPSENSTEQEFEQKRLSQTINAFVLALPEIEQKVFLCRYWYMDSISSVCRQFGFSESKIKSMLFRIRNKLRLTLEKEGFR